MSPVWAVEPADTAVLFGQLTVLNCQATGFPAPSVTWMRASGIIEFENRKTNFEMYKWYRVIYFNQFECHSTDREKTSFVKLESSTDLLLADNGSLIIHSAERQHEGYYQCNAKNNIGKGLTKTISLKVNGEYCSGSLYYSQLWNDLSLAMLSMLFFSSCSFSSEVFKSKRNCRRQTNLDVRSRRRSTAKSYLEYSSSSTNSHQAYTNWSGVRTALTLPVKKLRWNLSLHGDKFVRLWPYVYSSIR